MNLYIVNVLTVESGKKQNNLLKSFSLGGVCNRDS